MASSPYITAEGYAELNQELTARWARRRDVVKALSAAAAEGDRSENAEYIYRKKQLREIDRRVRYLQKRTAEMQVIEHTPSNQNKVFFGAQVTVSDDHNNETVYRIVGSDEFDAHPEYISVDSPMARALLGKELDDEVIVKLPEETKRLWIVDLHYPSPHE